MSQIPVVSWVYPSCQLARGEVHPVCQSVTGLRQRDRQPIVVVCMPVATIVTTICHLKIALMHSFSFIKSTFPNISVVTDCFVSFSVIPVFIFKSLFKYTIYVITKAIKKKQQTESLWATQSIYNHFVKNNTLTRLKLEQKGRTTSWQNTYIILLVNIKN